MQSHQNQRLCEAQRTQTEEDTVPAPQEDRQIEWTKEGPDREGQNLQRMQVGKAPCLPWGGGGLGRLPVWSLKGYLGEITEVSQATIGYGRHKGKRGCKVEGRA